MKKMIQKNKNRDLRPDSLNNPANITSDNLSGFAEDLLAEMGFAPDSSVRRKPYVAPKPGRRTSLGRRSEHGARGGALGTGNIGRNILGTRNAGSSTGSATRSKMQSPQNEPRSTASGAQSVKNTMHSFAEFEFGAKYVKRGTINITKREKSEPPVMASAYDAYSDAKSEEHNIGSFTFDASSAAHSTESSANEVDSSAWETAGNRTMDSFADDLLSDMGFGGKKSGFVPAPPRAPAEVDYSYAPYGAIIDVSEKDNSPEPAGRERQKSGFSPAPPREDSATCIAGMQSLEIVSLVPEIALPAPESALVPTAADHEFEYSSPPDSHDPVQEAVTPVPSIPPVPSASEVASSTLEVAPVPDQTPIALPADSEPLQPLYTGEERRRPDNQFVYTGVERRKSNLTARLSEYRIEDSESNRFLYADVERRKSGTEPSQPLYTGIERRKSRLAADIPEYIEPETDTPASQSGLIMVAELASRFFSDTPASHIRFVAIVFAIIMAETFLLGWLASIGIVFPWQ